MGAIAHTRGSLVFSSLGILDPLTVSSFFVAQEFLFYYQRDPAQERLPSGGG